MNMTSTGSNILKALQKSYSDNVFWDDKDIHQPFLKELLKGLYDVTIAWAALTKDRIFKFYVYTQEDIDKLKKGLGWIWEITSADEDRFILSINI